MIQSTRQHRHPSRLPEGRLQGLIGLAADVPYEPPEHPDLVLDTEHADARACAARLVEHLLLAHRGPAPVEHP